nr:sulfated surface glycoprotein 185-like [Tanacetum cinerariifolium]
MSTPFRIALFTILALLVVLPSPIQAMKSRKLDETTTSPPNDEIKCGSCPCGTTCYASPPPPKPSPPPPSPPPPPKKPSPANCPPPPYSGGGGGGGGGSGGGGGGSGGGGSGYAPPNYIYITGPPGDIYPVSQSTSDAPMRFAAMQAVLVVFGLVGMICLW